MPHNVTVAEEGPGITREIVIKDKILDKVQEVKDESENVSELEPRTANVKKTRDELAQSEVTIEEIRLCTDSSEITNLDESKRVKT
jgi:hypothetical protein